MANWAKAPRYTTPQSGGPPPQKYTADSLNTHRDPMSSMGEHQTKDSPGRIMREHYKIISLEKHDSSREKMISSLPEGEWAAAESQRRMTYDRMKSVCQKWNLYAKAQFPERQTCCWEEGLSSGQEVEWAAAKSQRGMTQDEVKIVCQGATPWKTGIFLRGRVELLTGGWLRCC